MQVISSLKFKIITGIKIKYKTAIAGLIAGRVNFKRNLIILYWYRQAF